MSVNRVVLVGRMTKNPEMQYTPAGAAVAKFSIAVNRFTKKEDGDYEVDFFDVTCWRKTAEFVSQYLGKGRLISVDGRLQQNRWTAQDGTNRSRVEIVAENVQGLDKKPDSAEANPSAEGHTSREPVAAAVGTPAYDNEEGDPFADES